ncbi:2'-5' RNA ligase family protein [Balneola sp. MJW-20]|uniref:2'-5' RNA ligase family protein n=1 Tax=Gracilimonas aurantiaca TaxID=3234185 RepID=UPI00346645EE
MPANKLYFIALIPPEPVYSAIHELKLKVSDHYGSRQALKSPPHITLISPFRSEESREKEILNLIRYHEPEVPIHVTLSGFDHFPGKVLFIHVNENKDLNELQANLEQKVRYHEELFSYNYDPRPWHPHITLGFKDWNREQFRKAQEEYQNRLFEAHFDARELYLLKHNGKNWEIAD